MPQCMYLYFPVDIDTTKEGYTMPTVESDAKPLVDFIKNAPPEDNNNNQGYNYNPASSPIKKFHQNKHDWIDILAWSHGVSAGGHNTSKAISFQNFSLTKYMDKYSSTMKYLSMKCERIPHAVLRCVAMPTNGKIHIAEHEMRDVHVTSVSTGGSGGEDRLTENITLSPKYERETATVINSETGEIISQLFSSWDIPNKQGERCLLTEPTEDPSSKGKQSAKPAVKETKAQSTEAKELSILVTTDHEAKKYSKITLKARTKAALIAAACEKLKVDPAKVKNVYEQLNDLGNFDLVELETDEDLADLSANAQIYIEQ